MAKITRTIEVEVCDRCGKETGGWKETCVICDKELCSQCDRRLTIVVERLGQGCLGFSGLFSLHHEGLKATFCVDHEAETERILREAGFKEFSYDVKPV